MNIKNKLTLLVSVTVICILIIADFIVYFLFIRTATHNEIQTLQSKAEQIIEKIGPQPLMRNSRAMDLRTMVPEDTAIRIVDENSKLILLVQNEPFELPPFHYAASNESELEDGDQNVIIVRVPIITTGSTPAGTLEMIEKMDSLDSSIGMLVTVLAFSTGGAALLSVIGGLLISRTIMNPISDHIRTMQDIERSLTFKKIPSHRKNKDELSQLTDTFNRMMERLEGSFLRQRQFVSDASHELNTTLTIIEGYAGMLKRWGTTNEEVQRESIENIYEESKRMKKMTRQLLDLASSQNDPKLEIESFSILECCKQAASLANKLHKRDIAVRAKGDLDPIIQADPQKIKQLLLILLDNALKYSDKQIEMTVSTQGEDTEIRVKDYGIGIPKEHIGYVFDRFYRVDQARQRQTGGAGLGLPIAKSIVQEHGGTIAVRSEEGVGTEFTVRLPNTQTREPVKPAE